MKKLVLLVPTVFILILSCVPTGRDYGKELYEDNCSNCHGIEGDGLQQLYPPIKNADYLTKHQSELACIIRFGMEGEIEVNGQTFSEPMPGKPLLTNVEIHNIINYISKNFHKEVKPVQLNDVDNQLMNCNKY